MELQELIAGHMKWIDRHLWRERVRLKMRAYSAARLFVEEAISEVSDGPKDDYATKPWFAVISSCRAMVP